ncbi:MAG: deoxyribodipyrimidine photo-lyase [Candidatus Verstraetearchaeota archaeon]|nr:deoxyribodipyrimidine photo-lyase [Candidatus Verstraetearchaeota archaeon]
MARLEAAGRVRVIKEPSKKGKKVVYWMQGAFRVHSNPSLEYAIRIANRIGLPLLVLVVLDLGYPEANYRSFKFFLEGLADVKEGLSSRGIALHLRKGEFEKILLEYVVDAHMLISDAAYLPVMRGLRDLVYRGAESGIIEVEPNVLVPVKVASDRMEYGAYTLRPKIRRLAPLYAGVFEAIKYKGERLDDVLDFEPSDHDKLLKGQVEYVHPCSAVGGSKQAFRILGEFLRNRYREFAELRGDPGVQAETELSPYLHFGHISPLQILEEAKRTGAPNGNYEALFEQLVVRRELAHNFTLYASRLDSPSKFIPGWAAETLKAHERDQRDYVYTLEELEAAKTHDRYWNAAQSELIERGKIHNYMRMYWGKKIMEWSETIEDAYEAMVYLNNKYALDGRDPNSYAGIGWCFGLHDRPFKERGIFGKVRYMSSEGLNRKFNMVYYLERVNNIGSDGRL